MSVLRRKSFFFNVVSQWILWRSCSIFVCSNSVELGTIFGMHALQRMAKKTLDANNNYCHTCTRLAFIRVQVYLILAVPLTLDADRKIWIFFYCRIKKNIYISLLIIIVIFLVLCILWTCVLTSPMHNQSTNYGTNDQHDKFRTFWNPNIMQ